MTYVIAFSAYDRSFTMPTFIFIIMRITENLLPNVTVIHRLKNTFFLPKFSEKIKKKKKLDIAYKNFQR